MSSTEMKLANKTERNYGIDALRLLSMLFVVILHVIGNGGILDMTSGLSYKLVFLIETIAYCAVNCYAAITGYVTYSDTEKPYRYEKYAGMWLQVFFYSFGVTLIAFLLRWGNVGLGTLVYAALPVTTGRYWYFSVYTGLFFFTPYLCRFVRSLSNRQMTILAIMMFALCSCYNCVTDPFAIGSGYSLPWLTVMYLLGAWIKKCDIANQIKGWILGVVMAFCWIFTWLYTLYSPVKNDILLTYTSPTIVLAALCLLVLFSKISVGSGLQKCIRFFAPATFGVYIIHMQPVLKEELLPNLFHWMAQLQWWLIPLAVLACAVAIFLLCLFIEKLRILVFNGLKLNDHGEKAFQKIWMFCGKQIGKIVK